MAIQFTHLIPSSIHHSRFTTPHSWFLGFLIQYLSSFHSREASLSTISRPIFRAAVAAGEGALQTLTAFQDSLRQAPPGVRSRLIAAMLEAIASHRVGDRFGRVEPRANKRRPKPQRYLKEPRKEARKRLMDKT